MLLIVPQFVLGQSPGQTLPGQTMPGESSPSQSTPGQTPPGTTGQGQSDQGQTGGAILHAQGGVWINGYEARDSSAVFPGDLLETKPGAAANLNLDGSTVLIQPESVLKLQTNLLELDHGSVSVGTSKSFKVRVHCMTVVPVLSEWTQYEVNNLNGSVQVAARKDDVNVERSGNSKKLSPETEASHGSTVRETEEKSFNESEICGAPAQPVGQTSGLSPKWIAIGAGGGGLLLCAVVCHGSGGGAKTPLSSSTP